MLVKAYQTDYQDMSISYWILDILQTVLHPHHHHLRSHLSHTSFAAVKENSNSRAIEETSKIQEANGYVIGDKRKEKTAET